MRVLTPWKNQEQSHTSQEHSRDIQGCHSFINLIIRKEEKYPRYT